MKFSYLFVIVLLIQGCILKKVAVSNADIGIESQIEKRLPLYSAQKTRLSLDVDKFLNESKPNLKAALPLIEALDLNEEKIDSQLHSLKETYVVIATDYINLLTKYMAELDEKQQKVFFVKFDETTSDYNRRTLAQQQEKLEDRFEIFFGEITPEQHKFIKNFAKYQMASHPEYLKTRLELREKILTILNQDLSSVEKSSAMTKLYLAYQNGILDNIQTTNVIKSIMSTLKVNQKLFFKNTSNELKELINHFLSINF